MLSLALYLAIGGGIGAAMGYFGQCSSGTCPLTSTWWRGALYGAGLGLVFYFGSGRDNSAALNQSTANVKRISASQFDAEVTQSSLPVVVGFYAPWCGPCKSLAPVLDQLAGEFTNQVRVVKVNVDESPELAQRYGVAGVPTLVAFAGGKPVRKAEGLIGRDDLKVLLGSLAAATGSVVVK